MTKQKPSAVAANPTNTLEIAVGRVKKDLVWVLVSVVISVASGLAIGSLVNF